MNRKMRKCKIVLFFCVLAVIMFFFCKTFSKSSIIPVTSLRKGDVVICSQLIIASKSWQVKCLRIIALFLYFIVFIWLDYVSCAETNCWNIDVWKSKSWQSYKRRAQPLDSSKIYSEPEAFNWQVWLMLTITCSEFHQWIFFLDEDVTYRSSNTVCPHPPRLNQGLKHTAHEGVLYGQRGLLGNFKQLPFTLFSLFTGLKVHG